MNHVHGGSYKWQTPQAQSCREDGIHGHESCTKNYDKLKKCEKEVACM